MSEGKIIIQRRYQHNHRSTKFPTTVNVSKETHAAIKALKDKTGMNYDEIVGMAITRLEGQLEVRP